MEISQTPVKHTIQELIDHLTAEDAIRRDAEAGRCPDAMANAAHHLREAKAALDQAGFESR